MNTATALARVPDGLAPRRAWPHRDGLAVEARTTSGQVVGVLVTSHCVHVLAAHDPALPALGPALARPGAELVGHRPGRRAVVRDRDGTYLKIFRRRRVGQIADRLRDAAGRLRDAPRAPVVPAVLDADPDAGWVRLTGLPGPSLHRLLHTDPDTAAAFTTRIADAVAALAAAPAAGLTRHDHADEAAVVQRWVDNAVAWADPADGSRLAAAMTPVAARLQALPTPAWVPCHRDLHDKQLLRVSPAGVGVLDLDTLCAADPALDRANLLAHLHLRTAQGYCDPATARRCARALLAHLTPGDVDSGAGSGPRGEALAAYAAAALLRLAAVYTFRPGPPDLTTLLLAAAADPVPAAWRNP